MIASLSLRVTAVAAITLGACSPGGGRALPDSNVPLNNGNAELLSVEYGRLVDVYGFEPTPDGPALALHQADVVIGPEIVDERASDSTVPDADVNFDFLSIDPDTLTPRLLIPREIGSSEFDRLLTEAQSELNRVTAGVFGQDTATKPFSVVPRNAALVLTFSESIGVGEDFFVTRGPDGRVNGVRNTEAIQLLRIVGDPTDDEHVGDFQLLPARIIPRITKVVLDPVFLGEEGVLYGTRNNASGMPPAVDQLGANIRLAIALDGPLSIAGIHADSQSPFVGKNNDVVDSVIRDFRSGNADDNSAHISRGFVRDPEPPRLLGAMPFLLVSVDERSASTQVVTCFKNGRVHDVDRGDTIRFVEREGGRVVTTEVAEDPADDRGMPEQQFVRIPVRRARGLAELDPRLDADYPDDPTGRDGRQWLRSHAPQAVLIAEYTGARIDPATGREFSDDPANFLTFTPEPFEQMEGYDPLPGEPSPPNLNISPFAAAVVRFTKPVDLDTVGAFDTLFFATRDVLSESAREEFRLEMGLTEEQFTIPKFITPHLVDARVFDVGGSQTTLRLQPVMGFYLDDDMREPVPPSFTQIPVSGGGSGTGTTASPIIRLPNGEPLPRPIATTTLPYFLQIVTGPSGIRDLSGNPVDLQSETVRAEHLSIPFFLDGRRTPSGAEVHESNLAVSLVRRFEATDEDEQPSLYQLSDPSEYQFPMDDVFGSVGYNAGQLSGRTASRIRKVVDNVNQSPPPPQDSVLRWCPERFVGPFRTQETRASNSASVAFPQGIQNPLNPYGARLQTVWREIDMSLSRVDPSDFNLDVEQLYWAPVTTATVLFDIFDSVSLYLGHSEYRPEPCVGSFSALPVFDGSGLVPEYALNYAHDQLPIGTGSEIDRSRTPAPHPAYLGAELIINPQEAVLEPNGINRFLALPEFRKPYFVWRDETVLVQGGETAQGNDTLELGGAYAPYIISPFLHGQCEPLIEVGGAITASTGFWDNRDNYQLRAGRVEAFTGGLLGTVALPLLADFQTDCDSPDLPEGFGFVAQGFNGWQVALSVQSDPRPNFRVFTGGDRQQGVCVGPNHPGWTSARGQINGSDNRRGDNSVYWTMADFVKRQTVATMGFVDILNPHRMPPTASAGRFDPRLGPYFGGGRPANVLPRFEWHFEPPLSSLPGGTSIVPEFRAASQVAVENWHRPSIGGAGSGAAPGEPNPCFALNPLCAGDAHIRKYDDRTFRGLPRNYWSYFYNEHVTDYSADVEDLLNPVFLDRFSGPNANDKLTPDDVVYFNWRFVMTNNVEISPPVSPSIRSFAISYRFEEQP